MNNNKKLAYVILRAQLPTFAHFSLINRAAKEADHVLVLIGSSNRSISNRNPFKWQFRESLLKAGMGGNLSFRVSYAPLKDYVHMEHEWELEVSRRVGKEMKSLNITDNSDVTMVVHEKDNTTYYSTSFPQWALTKVESFGDYNATDAREAFLTGKSLETFTPGTVINLLEQYKVKERNSFEWLVKNRQGIIDYKKPYLDLPYGIKFMTGDPMVVCDGHVLVIQRDDKEVDSSVGALQWALPGGFVNMNETVLSAIRRELLEETSIDVPKKALRQGYRGMKRFEGATRDERGDYTTHCGIFFIERNTDGTLPGVKPGSDARDAKWKTFNEISEMSKYMYADHSFIIEVMRRLYCTGEHNFS